MEIHGYSRLKKLGPDKWAEVLQDFMNGASPNAVAKKIRVDWGAFGDVQENTLIQQLKRLRLVVLEESPQIDIEAEKETALALTGEVLQDSSPIINLPVDLIDCERELADLVRIQKKRIMDQVKKEGAMPMPLPHIGEMINDLAALIKDIGQEQKASVNEVWSELFSAEGYKDISS